MIFLESRSSGSEFSSISSVYSNRRPFSVDLNLGNKQVHRGKYGGCGTTVISFLVRNSRINDAFAGALSW
jgi:hypothetical protein